MATDGMRPLALRALRMLVLVYGGVTVMAATFADRLIFIPPAPSYDADAEGLVRFPTAEGDTVAAIYLPVPGARLTVLFAHGNAEDLGDLRPHLEVYRAMGVSVLAFDYPGYGMSSGTPSEKGSYAAADAALEHLRSQFGVEVGRVVAHGRSLGGAVMVDLAARQPVAGLIIESSFVSAFRVMTGIPIIPFDKFRSLAKLPDVAGLVLVIHGTADEVIAPWHGRRLSEAVPEGRRRTLWVEGAGHNDLALVAGESYWATLRSYLDSITDTLRID